MDEENIYEDLDDFILEQQVEQVQENNKELTQTIEKLEETTKKFNEEISDLKKINKNLERNISSLFKTAKNEIERKDKRIAQLQKQLDNTKFKKVDKKPPKLEGNNEALMKETVKLKCMIEQKNRIIQSLTKELEYVKKDLAKQEKKFKRDSSHIENADLRNRLSKKRKLDDKDYKRDNRRPRSRSKSRDSRTDDRLKSRFDKKRSGRRNRSRSLEQRKSSNRSAKYSRSRSPSPNKKSNTSQFSEKNGRTHTLQHPEKVKQLRSRSRSSSMDRKKFLKHCEVFSDDIDKINKCETKLIHNNHLIKEDSGISSSNSHTSELIKSDSLPHPPEDLKPEDLEEGEIDCSLEDINSDEDSFFCQKTIKMDKNIKCELVVKDPEVKDDVLELMVQSNYLDDLDIDEEITKMRMFEDDKRKKRKEDKQRMYKLRTAISECKQNIQLLEHNIYNDEETETEEEFISKTGSFVEEQNNLVLKISKGTIVKSKTENTTQPIVEVEKTTEDVVDKNDVKDILQSSMIKEDEDEDETNKRTEIIETIITNMLDDALKIDENIANIDNIENSICENKLNTEKNLNNGSERKAPLKAKRRRAFICIT